MTVHPPLAVIPDWGPSLTFISKPGGYKYVTDQYAALQASTWNKRVEEEMERNKEEEEEMDRRNMQNKVPWEGRENHKMSMTEDLYPRLGRQSDPKTRTGPYRGKYSVIGRRTGVGRRTGIGRKGIRNKDTVKMQNSRVDDPGNRRSQGS